VTAAVPSPRLAAIIVMGVSGSGKTTVAALLAGRLGWEFEDGDWLHPPENVRKMEAGTPLNDDDRWPWLHAIADWIAERRRDGGHGVIACSALKRAYRDILLGDQGDVRLVYLKGDAELIGRRIRARHGHFMPPELLRSQFQALEEPAPEEKPITVSIEPRPHEIVATILDALAAETEAT